MQLLFQEAGPNHEVTVYETGELYGEKGLFRVLQFSNEAIQGALDLHRPERIVFEYPRAILHLMEHNHPSFEDVFMIGHGIGTIASHLADRRCKIAELDRTVVEVSRRFFGYGDNNVVVGDGRQLLERERSKTYDCIIVDAFTDQGTPRKLVSTEFFQLTSDKLDAHGSILLNLMGRGDKDPLLNAIHTTMSEVFAYTKAFVLRSEEGSRRDLQNIILMGSGSPIGYQARQMAGFTEFELAQGYLIRDHDTG
ncbi:spermidine synthase [Paenibacillus cremeus]|uniref:spermidine synthase n=1 Tax=Paenibacillus cremeus TaxID=2163881 RepID=UPI0021BD3742|nr:fused MFS/spermidine synthase [Paenibacillus cremeus]